MSRIGKKPIDIPQNTEVTVSDSVVMVKGPKGSISRNIVPYINVKVENNQVVTEPQNSSIEANALWGTMSSHINNMIEGVNNAFVKKLVIEGVGFKMDLKGDILKLNAGFSHPVEVKIPEGIKCELEKDTLTISGVDKEAVGQFSAKVRAIKKPEPYKGKGIRYSDEVVRRKEGKKSV